MGFIWWNVLLWVMHGYGLLEVGLLALRPQCPLVGQVVVQSGQQRPLDHSRPQEQRPLHQLLPLDVRVTVMIS